MFALRDSLKSKNLNWSDPNPCVWTSLGCDAGSRRVSRIQIGNRGISGALTSSLSNLPALTIFEVMGNSLAGNIPSLTKMHALTKAWLQETRFSGAIPVFSGLTSLKLVNVSGNQLTGIVPESLTELTSLSDLALGNNLLQGPTPSFKSKSMNLDMTGLNSFCLDVPGAPCDPRVNDLLSIVEGFGFPAVFAERWKVNDMCNSTNKWVGITCYVLISQLLTSKAWHSTALSLQALHVLELLRLSISLTTILTVIFQKSSVN
ncbi:hypothetical protein Bca4012_006660 [Brassica carinata]